MKTKEPKNDSKYEWTEHSKYKMKQYGLSAQRVLRVIRSPKRIEEGIVEKTVAVMQPSSMKTDKEGKRTWGQEIWVMYQLRGSEVSSKFQVTSDKKNTKLKVKSSDKAKDLIKLTTKKLRIISAWRFPGVSDENNPIPEDIMREIEDVL